jgi:hypothetical protein
MGASTVTNQSRLGRLLVAALTFFLAIGSAAWADVVQGGFRLFDPENPSGREVGVLSLGPLVLAGARTRTSPAAGVPGICNEAIFVMLGAEGAKRKDDRLKVKQKSDLVVFFVISQCTGDEKECILGTSLPVAVEGCAGSVDLRKQGGVSGRVKVRCKDGVALSAPGFGLSAEEQQGLAGAFPGISEGVALSFKDEAGQEETGPDLAFKIQNLDADAIDDVVGTYLADDALPLCVTP